MNRGFATRGSKMTSFLKEPEQNKKFVLTAQKVFTNAKNAQTLESYNIVLSRPCGAHAGDIETSPHMMDFII